LRAWRSKQAATDVIGIDVMREDEPAAELIDRRDG
jgi:hypothetical protein